MASKALEGVRVLEYCTTNSGPYCTKLMADLGAEVIHLEPPRTGDDARRSPPFPQEVPHPEKSGLFLFLNSNKLGITLDPQLPQGRKIFEELVRDVDVLVEDRPPKQMERMGLGYHDLRQSNPALRPHHFSKTPCELERAAPLLGEHNEMIYCERLGYDTDELKELEKAGVAATPSLSSKALFNDPHLVARKTFTQVEHPELGKDWVVAPPWRLSDTAASIRRHGPLLGEHNFEVFERRLGMSREEIERLEEERVIY